SRRRPPAHSMAPRKSFRVTPCRTGPAGHGTYIDPNDGATLITWTNVRAGEQRTDLCCSDLDFRTVVLQAWIAVRRNSQPEEELGSRKGSPQCITSPAKRSSGRFQSRLHFSWSALAKLS